MKKILLLLLMIGCGSSAGTINNDAGPADARPDAVSTVDAVQSLDAMPPVCMADIANDRNNCGACGRQCLGTNACRIGRCEAETVIENATKLGDFTADNLFAYYTGIPLSQTAHRVWKMAIGSPNPPAYAYIFADNNRISQFAFDDSQLYIADPILLGGSRYAKITKYSKDLTASVTLAEYQETVTTAICLQSGFLYYATAATGANGGDIRKISTSGGAPSIISVTTGNVQFIMADATNVFWVDNTAALRRAPLASGLPVLVAAGRSDFFDMDDVKIYMVRKDTQDLVTVDKANSQLRILGVGFSAGGAVDSTYIYAAQNNKLVAMLKNGSPIKTLWEALPEDLGTCIQTYNIMRTKVIGSYVYFSVSKSNCAGNEPKNFLYRIARL